MDATTGVDAAVYWTIGEIAQRDGVSKQAVSKHVGRMVDQHQLAVERDGQGRIARVNVAAYDILRGRYGDPSKAQAPRPSAMPAMQPGRTASGEESYDEAVRRRAVYDAETRRIGLEELQRLLVRRSDVVDATRRLGQAIVAIVERLPNAADDIAAAVASEGTHGARLALKRLALRMREEMVAAIAEAAAQAPAEAAPPVTGADLAIDPGALPAAPPPAAGIAGTA